jgi:hypothetical protein
MVCAKPFLGSGEIQVDWAIAEINRSLSERLGAVDNREAKRLDLGNLTGDEFIGHTHPGIGDIT